MSRSFRSSRPDSWTSPRPHTDASHRLHAYGPVHSYEPAAPWGRVILAAVIAFGLLLWWTA